MVAAALKGCDMDRRHLRRGGDVGFRGGLGRRRGLAGVNVDHFSVRCTVSAHCERYKAHLLVEETDGSKVVFLFFF